jgi:hypothetical protein
VISVQRRERKWGCLAWRSVRGCVDPFLSHMRLMPSFVAMAPHRKMRWCPPGVMPVFATERSPALQAATPAALAALSAAFILL